MYGSGLFESVYEEIFSYEWSKFEIPFRRQQGIPLQHEELRLDACFRADFIIDNKVIIELKSVEALAEIHYKTGTDLFEINRVEIGITCKF